MTFLYRESTNGLILGIIWVQWNPSVRTLLNWGHVFPPQVPLLHAFQPLKWGHLTKKDTFFCPISVRIREVPLYIQCHVPTQSLPPPPPLLAFSSVILCHLPQEAGDNIWGGTHAIEEHYLAPSHEQQRYRWAIHVSTCTYIQCKGLVCIYHSHLSIMGLQITWNTSQLWPKWL